MKVELEQLELAKMLLEIRDKVTLGKVKDVLLSAHEEGRISLKKYNEELEMAEKRIDSGYYTTQENVESEAKEW
ncbi:MAG TPA: hypothetical protein DIW47_01075 [Bacteroidetes bacterium]|nr:hypothetical protein [Bacteroidota bacterium]